MSKLISVWVIAIVMFPGHVFFGHFQNGVADKLDFGHRIRGMDGHTDPAGFVGQVSLVYFTSDASRHFFIYMKQKVPVSACTGTSSPGLYPKAVIQELNSQVKVQVFDVE